MDPNKNSSSGTEWGIDALNTLMAFIPGGDETYKLTPLLIMAGYRREMENMMNFNPGI